MIIKRNTTLSTAPIISSGLADNNGSVAIEYQNTPMF
jgi:hypothetical protein